MNGSGRVIYTTIALLASLLMALQGCGDEDAGSEVPPSEEAADVSVEDGLIEDGESPGEEEPAPDAEGSEESAEETETTPDSWIDEVDGEQEGELDSVSEEECEASSDCDDGNACSQGLCIGGNCEWIPISVLCDDGTVCTANDICVGLTCAGEPLVCDDSDPCTQDSCDDQEGCRHDVLDPACYEEELCEGEDCEEDPCLNGDDEACEALNDLVQVVAGGQFTCGRTLGGEVWCWGSNTQGQLGNGSTLTYIVPSKVIGISGAKDITAGFGHACAIVASGEVRCWGGNTWGQLGDGTNTGSLATSVAGLSDMIQVSAGTAHTCALSASGRVYCWGQGTFGQLGNGEAKSYSVPVEVNDIVAALQITTGGHHSCAVFGGGFLSCWGYNGSGQLGNVSVEGLEVSPSPVFDQTEAIFVDAYGDTTCSVSAGGELHCWGSNSSAKLGISAADVPGSLVPVVIDVGEDAKSVAVGESHVCVLLNVDGYVSCWGVNDFIVDLPIESAAQPTHIGELAPALSIISGQQHMCAMHEGAAVSCWGTNINGQLGNGGKLSSSSPTPVVGLP